MHSIIIIAFFFAAYVYINDPKQRMAFSIGWLFMVCVDSLCQDAIGKEAYLEYVSTHWTAGIYTVPFTGILLLFGMLAIRNLNRTTITINIGKKQEDKPCP